MRNKIKAGCFGAPGSYSAEAMERFFAGKEKEEKYYSLFEDLVKAVKNGEADCGILPIENSSTGGITDVYDLLRRYDCFIIGEKCIKIEHNLMALPGTKIEDIRKVYSHPQGLAQCRKWFAGHPDMELIPYFSTSESAELVKNSGSHAVAAIAGKTAAALCGLEILAARINTNAANCTRFFLITAGPKEVEQADKVTLVMQIPHIPGSLYRALGCFEKRGLNLTNIESRPLDGHPFEYFFHIDIMGNLKEGNVKEAFRELEGLTVFCKVLGNYRADRGEN